MFGCFVLQTKTNRDIVKIGCSDISYQQKQRYVQIMFIKISANCITHHKPSPLKYIHIFHIITIFTMEDASCSNEPDTDIYINIFLYLVAERKLADVCANVQQICACTIQAFTHECMKISILSMTPEENGVNVNIQASSNEFSVTAPTATL